MKKYFVTLLALVTGWQARRLSAAAFPTGTFTRCAQGRHNPSGNEFLNSAGFENGARLTLGQSGTTVTTTFVDQNGLSQSLSFSATTDTVATITQMGQVIPGFKSLCVLGPGRETGHAANMSVTAGALTYDAGVVFLTLTGDLRSDSGACGARSQPQASFWVACEDRQGGAVPIARVRPAPVPQLRAGRYSCSSQVETLYRVNDRDQYVAGGATGTVMLMKNGAKVLARYSDDTSVAGTLHFTATTSTTASAQAGQSLMAPCMISKETGRPSGTPEPVPIAGGSLTMMGSTLFLSFAGTMAESSSCPGAQVAGSLICSK